MNFTKIDKTTNDITEIFVSMSDEEVHFIAEYIRSTRQKIEGSDDDIIITEVRKMVISSKNNDKELTGGNALEQLQYGAKIFKKNK